MYNHEFTESKHKVNRENDEMSKEDLNFLQVLDNDAHYKLPLPLRDDNFRLPNSRSQAEMRFRYLEIKMSMNYQFKNDYMKFMKELISKEYATASTAVAETRKCWYLPYHGVYNQNSPGKILVFANLSAEFSGKLINNSLLPDPDLYNQIVGVLPKFREEPLAVTGDIEAIYHQVKIPVKKRNFLQFLW